MSAFRGSRPRQFFCESLSTSGGPSGANECNGDFSSTIAQVEQFASLNKFTIARDERPHASAVVGLVVGAFLSREIGLLPS